MPTNLECTVGGLDIDAKFGLGSQSTGLPTTDTDKRNSTVLRVLPGCLTREEIEIARKRHTATKSALAAIIVLCDAHRQAVAKEKVTRSDCDGYAYRSYVTSQQWYRLANTAADVAIAEIVPPLSNAEARVLTAMVRKHTSPFRTLCRRAGKSIVAMCRRVFGP